MKAQILLALAFISNSVLSTPTLNQTSKIRCKLPKSETLKIGCTNYCGRFNTWGLKKYARRMGYKLKLVNLRTNKQSIDYTQVDGVIIPGGSDIDPKWYKDAVTLEMKKHIESIEQYANYTRIGRIRDEFEFNFLKDYFADQQSKTQPILGICRGMQVLTVSQGIPLYVDIKKELGISNRIWKIDKIYHTKKSSLLKELIPKKRFRAVELHHQGLNIAYFNKHKEKWPYLDITSVSNKGLIAESLEFKDRPILGVQFHPEYTFGKVRKGIFKWLLNRACINHQINNRK